MNILIPMAGLGDRFKSQGYQLPKPLIDVMGKPMIERVIESLGLIGHFIFVINKNSGYVDKLKTLLNRLSFHPTIIEIDYITEGPASTCLLAKEFIKDKPLIITNCDQIMEWDGRMFNAFTYGDMDGTVVTYPIKTEKNSYVRLDENDNAIEFAEKKIISEYSLNGIHYWKNGSDFINSAEEMIKKNIRVNNEFYIAPTYNEMIADKTKKVTIYEISLEEHWAVGTPEDLNKYLEHVKI
jgi:NDP-sugar pyrophosphorylase family protein